MKRRRLSKLRTTATTGAILLPLVLAGCGIFGSGDSAQVDPPPTEVELQMLEGAEHVAETSYDVSMHKPSTVYLKNEQGLLAPVSIQLPTKEEELSVQSSLEALIDGGPYAGALPEGFSGVLPHGTEVKAVTINKEQKLAIVEFTKLFGSYAAADERKILEAVTWTLTENPEVQNVQLWIDGQKINAMPVDATPISEPLNRSLGINLEISDGVNYSQTSPVTVYFSAATVEGIQYFVPVTRLVPSGRDVLKSALNALIEGPASRNGLEKVLTSNTTVESVETSKDGVVTVELKDDMFEAGEKPPAQMLQSLVLTITENAKNVKVRLGLNGQHDVVGTDNQSYSEPVARPDVVNDIPI